MAISAKTTTPTNRRPNMTVTSWTVVGYTSSDTFEALELTGADRSVQFVGTVTATVVLQGSNDGTTWVTLTDPLGTSISTTSAGLYQIGPLTRYVRPNITSGTPGTGCTAWVVERTA